MIEFLVYFFIACALITIIGLSLTFILLPFAILTGLFAKILPKEPDTPD